MQEQSIVPVIIGFVGGLVFYHFLGEMLIEWFKDLKDRF